MGKISEYVCGAFEDICIAEKAHRETGGINTVRDHLKRAYITLANYDGTVDRCLMSSNLTLWDMRSSTERSVYEHAMNCIRFLLEEMNLTDIFNDYQDEYFNN